MDNSQFQPLDLKSSFLGRANGNLANAILDRINAFVFIVDTRNLHFIWVNRYMINKLGYSFDELINRSSDELLTLIDEDYQLTFTDRLNPDKKIQLRAEPFPIKILSKENHSLHVLLSLNYFELPLDNEKRYIVAFGTDINIFDLREYLDSAYSDKKVSIQKSLSPREICVLKLISKGRKDKEIAEILKISIHTAKTHRKNIIHKMGQTNSGSLINYAIENRLV